MEDCITTYSKLKAAGASAQSLRKVAAYVQADGTVTAKFCVEAARAFARLAAKKPSELERAEKVIVRAARLLDRIVAGDLRDNGSDTDKLTAASIKRHGPGIIISYIQLGVDVHKVYDYYKGASDEPLPFQLG